MQVDTILQRLRSYIHSSLLLKASSGIIILNTVAAVGGFITSILLARLLGPKELGSYVLIMAAINLAATLASLGLPFLVTREVAKYNTLQQWGLLKGLIRISHKWIAIVCVCAGGWALLFANIVLPGLSWVMWMLALLLISLTAFNQLRAAILRGLHWVLLADIPELLLRPLLVLSMVSSIYVWFGRASVSEIIFLQFLASLFAFLVGACFLHTRTPQPVSTATLKTHARLWGKEVQPFFWIAIVAIMEGQIGLYLLGYLAGPEQVGLFQVASQLVGLVVMGLVAVNMPLQPKLAAAWAKGDKNEVQQLVTEAAKLGTAVALASMLVFLPCAELVIHLYGVQYMGAANVLRILVVAQFINAASGPCGLVLSATGKQRLALYGVSGALAVNAAVSALLASHYGAIGSAFAAMTGVLTWNGLLVYWASRQLKINTSIFFCYRQA